MKVIGIVGSPRQQGNTEFLVREALKAAKEAGAEEIEMISLAPKKFSLMMAVTAASKRGNVSSMTICRKYILNC